MAKFVIECPNCGNYNEMSTSLFARKNVECSCGFTINIRKNRYTSRICEHCGNTVVYDQSRGEKARCIVCHEKFNTTEQIMKLTTIECPSCACKLIVKKTDDVCVCPLCETEINVKEHIAIQEMKKHGSANIIKYEGPNDVLVWKHPIQDINFGSELIVYETQEAVFFKDGKVLDVFGAGRFTLTPKNLPLLKEYTRDDLSKGEIFHSEVYFVNLVTQMGIKWGTDSKIRMFDPISGLHVELGASGEFNLRIKDSRKILLKLVGTSKGMVIDEKLGNDYGFNALNSKFKALVINKVKTHLAKTIRTNDINILEVDEHLEEISNILKNEINLSLEEYGLVLPEFYVTTIVTPDDDPNFRKLKEQHAERYLKVQDERIKKAQVEAAYERKILEAKTIAEQELIVAQAQAQALKVRAEAEAEEMRLKGFTYQQETQRKVAMGAVQNGNNIPSGSNVASDILNIGLGLGVVGSVMDTVKDSITQFTNNDNINAEAKSWDCPNCNYSGNTGNFCPNCGTKGSDFNK